MATPTTCALHLIEYSILQINTLFMFIKDWNVLTTPAVEQDLPLITIQDNMSKHASGFSEEYYIASRITATTRELGTYFNS